jgi:hypothetical protein
MSDCIWVCERDSGKEVPWGFFPDYNGGTDEIAEGDQTYKDIRRISAGEAIPKNEMPSKFYHSAANKFDKNIPDFFVTQHFFFKDPIADIMRGFDMGGGYFQPTQFVQWDRTTPIADDVFTLCVGNAKDTVDLEQTRGLGAWHGGKFTLPLRLTDEQIVTRSVGLAGPDIWCDPKIAEAYFFLSSRLADALIAAGHKKLMGLKATTTI